MQLRIMVSSVAALVGGVEGDKFGDVLVDFLISGVDVVQVDAKDASSCRLGADLVLYKFVASTGVGGESGRLVDAMA